MDTAAIEGARALRGSGARCIDLVRALADRNLDQVAIMICLRESLGLQLSDVTCLGGWHPDGTGELSDDDLDRLLERAVARASST